MSPADPRQADTTPEAEGDFLDEIMAESTARNPRFPQLVEQALARRSRHAPAVLIGDPAQDYDPETDGSDRLAIGRLGDEVQSRWVCSGCQAQDCVAYVERYRDGQGSTFALCEDCLWSRFPMRS